jgi:pullulanase
MLIFNASLANFTTVLISVDDISLFNIKNFQIKNGELLPYIDGYTINGNIITLYIKSEINIKKLSFVNYGDLSTKIDYTPLYSSEEFHTKYYTDKPLGAFYTKDFTDFYLWTPIASYVNLLIYEKGDPSIQETPKRFKMVETNGLWNIRIKGNLKGYFFTYEIKVHSIINEAVDPYAKAVGINGLRGAIIDLQDTSPKGFNKDFSPPLENYTDAIIYELSIRDISIHPDSGIKNKGKFLGLAEDNTFSSKDVSTGLQHIKELGVTHIQIMPIFDFSGQSIDEKNPFKYNWGYDPINYNVPEGSYSTDPYFPMCRIFELKKMIQQLHRNNLSIIMDVVYNHVFHNTENSFHRVFPGYYFRYDKDGKLSDGSGCGNDIASERLMVRKFILDSILFWATEYHIDGFRMDLMGLHDITTVNMIREALNKYKKDIMLYGEGWNLNTSLPDSDKASMYNAKKLPLIGHFNDIIRDSTKGSVFSAQDRGFISGKEGLENTIGYCVTGCTFFHDGTPGIFNSSMQSINYVSSHDNYTLWDKLELSNAEATIDELKARYKMADAIVLTSQGIPFIHSGAEFCRTKHGISNSYNSTDTINRIDWNRKSKFMDVNDYYIGLIKLRKEHPAFRMSSLEDIKNNLLLLTDMPKGITAFLLKNYANGDSWSNILVIYNTKNSRTKLTVPYGLWNIVVNKDFSGTKVLNSFSGHELEVEPISVTVAFSI